MNIFTREERMKKKVLGIMLMLALIGMSLALNIQQSKASGTIYIKSDGSIDPPTANITRNGNVYMLTADIYDSIVVQRDNIVLDGANHIIQGTVVTGYEGIDLSERSNVTVKNIRIKAFDCGVFLSASSNNNITGCTITNSNYGIGLFASSSYNNIAENTLSANYYYGVYLEFSSNNDVIENNIATNNVDGLKLFAGSSSNNIIGNNLTANGNNGIYIRASSNNILRNNRMANNKYNFYVDGSLLTDFVQDIDTSNIVNGKPVCYLVNKQNMAVPSGAGYVGLANCTSITVQNLELAKNGQGILLAYTTNSIITMNNISANYRGITIRYASNNKIYHNNFLNNVNQIFNSGMVNIWDDDYPSGGNYWSDYAGVDLYGGSSQTQPGKDGIGDSQYSVDSFNFDRYPLMTRFGEPTTRFVPNRYQTIQEAIDAANSGDEIFVYSGTYYGNVIVNKILSLIGENKNNTIIDGLGIRSVVSVINSKNVLIKGFIIRNGNLSSEYAGISVSNSDNCTITENTVIQNGFGILVTNSSHCVLSRNNISLNIYGGKFQLGSQNCEIIRNIIEANMHYGLSVDSSNNYLIINNLLKTNEYGITITGSTSGGIIYHNNFINNIHQVGGNPVSTQWNSSYPSGGNYWSDYAGVDLYSGPSQTEPGSDGIGDSPYFIDASTKDNYPLMNHWTNIAIVNVLSSKPVVGRGYSLIINVTVENQGYDTASFNLTVHVNVTFIEMKQVILSGGYSSNITFDWNTTDFVIGNYNINTIATVALGERNTVDNTFNSYWIQVTKVGDFGGGYPPRFFDCDGTVDGRDLALFLTCYKRLAPPEAMYLGDLGGGFPPQFYDCDGVVDGKDLALFLQCFKKLGPYA
jgi:parallel beta-helix repeat protein